MPYMDPMGYDISSCFNDFGIKTLDPETIFLGDSGPNFDLTSACCILSYGI